MLFMVIERLDDQDLKPVYERLRDEGRMMPDSLAYERSWVQADFDRCFQLVECDDVADLQRWVANWQDVVGFEPGPVLEGSRTAEAVGSLLGWVTSFGGRL